MGLLWIDENSDLLNGFSWHKSQEPVFQTSERNSQYGPGHNFTKGADGEDILVYHARPEKSGRRSSGKPESTCSCTTIHLG